MGSIGTGIVKIVDTDGDVLSATNGRLDVNTTGESVTITSSTNLSVSSSTAEPILGHGAFWELSDEVWEASPSIDWDLVQAARRVDIMAALDNTGIIYIGGSGLSATTGIALFPGDLLSIDIDNLNDVFAIGSVSNENIAITYYQTVIS